MYTNLTLTNLEKKVVVKIGKGIILDTTRVLITLLIRRRRLASASPT